MLIDTDSMIPISQAERDFSQAARLADRFGTAVIIQNDHPRYLIRDLTREENQAYLTAIKEAIDSDQ